MGIFVSLWNALTSNTAKLHLQQTKKDYHATDSVGFCVVDKTALSKSVDLRTAQLLTFVIYLVGFGNCGSRQLLRRNCLITWNKLDFALGTGILVNRWGNDRFSCKISCPSLNAIQFLWIYSGLAVQWGKKVWTVTTKLSCYWVTFTILPSFAWFVRDKVTKPVPKFAEFGCLSTSEHGPCNDWNYELKIH